jgi:hypothetical protein
LTTMLFTQMFNERMFNAPFVTPVIVEDSDSISLHITEVSYLEMFAYISTDDSITLNATESRSIYHIIPIIADDNILLDAGEASHLYYVFYKDDTDIIAVFLDEDYNVKISAGSCILLSDSLLSGSILSNHRLSNSILDHILCR